MWVRFQSIKNAISYCGLCGAEKRSADKGHAHADFPSKRNKHIQQVLVEAAEPWHHDTAMNWL